MLLVIETKVVVEAPDGTDPEELASEFARGYSSAIAPFSNAGPSCIVHADVTGIRPATEHEEREYSE